MPLFKAPENGVAVRMYRHGHGDCYLLAIPNKDPDQDPVHVLIDCGYKPGSQKFVNPPANVEDMLKDIQESTNNKLDLVIVTHEHQDHVNLFPKKKRGKAYFDDVDIQNAWFAWTESPTDRLAKKLRKKHGDQLLQLVEARNQLASFAADGARNPTIKQIDSVLAMELAGEDDAFNRSAFSAAAKDPSKSINKRGIKLIKDNAGKKNTKYLSPGKSILVPNTDVRAYILGPPRRESLLTDEDPIGDESFPGHGSGAHGLSFGSAVRGDMASTAPFAAEYCIDDRKALAKKYFKDHYGRGRAGINNERDTETVSNADWRRIDGDWLYSAGSLALKLNTGINNTSLVVAFELPNSKRVLLFVGDAQRGNWISWDDKKFKVDGKTVTARELLGRTVLYKTGHHGSHNATLAGEADDDYPNLAWMGSEEFGDEFVAMINAVNKWAMTKNNPPWRHPLKSIKEALHDKAQGRVFQTDTRRLRKPRDVSKTTWDDFKKRSKFKDLYFEYEVIDE